MSELTKETLLKIVDSTLSWGDDVADMWAGTQYEVQIDAQKSQVKKSLENNDLEKVRNLVFDLAQFLDHAERAYNE